MPSQVAIIKKNYSHKITTYALITIILLAGAAYYSYLQYIKLTSAQNALITAQEQSDNLQVSVDQYSKGYDEMKKAFSTDFKGTLDAVSKVYPSAENYTALTIALDDFFKNTTTPDNPLFAGDLKFSQPVIDDKKDYATLPFTMTISATKDSFKKFLQYIESSGSLDDQTRLMDIVSISINFPSETQSGAAAGEFSAGPSTYAISLSMNSYFQKPASAATPAQPAA
jgi:hypothetical protein